ncbi:MAG TPA: right-handed parallel beta-helix repeat-containing protein [Candidatus Acidoferrales bacterium]|nr:right-handed parallel beta-helix repeat-containing protein [Candidatus Acidoferrales bacterium]
MKNITKLCTLIMTLLFAALTVPAGTRGATVSVNCNLSIGPLHSITAALKFLNPQEPNTLNVSGACKENVVIQSFDRLTLNASPGASITDVSGGNLDVVDIIDSQRVSMNGFIVNGGANGVGCLSGSLCRFSGNTIQEAANRGAFVNNSHASFTGDELQDNAGSGLSVIDNGSVTSAGITAQGNFDGITLNTNGLVVVFGATIRNNKRFGVFGTTNSTFRCVPCNITGSGSDGVRLAQSSTGRFDSFFGAYSITGNEGAGVRLRDLSFSFFDAGNITGNLGGTDVVCDPQFSATRGALPASNIGGGTTNCSEP